MDEPFGARKLFQISLKCDMLLKRLQLSRRPHVQQGQGSASVPGVRGAACPGEGAAARCLLQSPAIPSACTEGGGVFTGDSLFIYLSIYLSFRGLQKMAFSRARLRARQASCTTPRKVPQNPRTVAAVPSKCRGAIPSPLQAWGTVGSPGCPKPLP